MNLSVGIVGLPNVGKSTLFNALLKKQQAFVANYPFATIEPNIGVVPVHDERLDELAQITKNEHKMSDAPPIIYATVKFVDIAGLVKGASEGAGLGNKFLSHIREVSVIAHVVRSFEDPNVVKEGSVSPLDDYKVVRTELELADLEKGGDIAKKPELIVLNVSEKEYSKDKIEEIVVRYTSILDIDRSKIIVISAKIEAELAALSEDEQKEYLKNLGLQESGLERLIRKAYEDLGLISFLTAGEKEVRAWTVRLGSTSLTAAGEIHTDFMKKFIKAEVVTYDDFVANGGWKGSRDAGKARLEGRDYIIRDGDIVEFKIGT
ncbi:MAG: GTP-binding protein YchF [Candidatus Levybacteria bacterium GW2011_GWA2_40_8]|nr:MAG: GTP-binding protein YchF [Candidatus Levybacteria bacterium GW2011_GWA2_40_8]